MRAVGRHKRTVISQPHFEIFLSPGQVQHLNFATPLAPDPADWAESIAATQVVFVQHSKRPYLEFIADLHPTLAPALEKAGMVCESRAPLMVLDLPGLAPCRSRLPWLSTNPWRPVTRLSSKAIYGTRVWLMLVTGMRRHWPGCPIYGADWKTAVFWARFCCKLVGWCPARSSSWGAKSANWSASGPRPNGASEAWPTPSAISFCATTLLPGTAVTGFPLPKGRRDYMRDWALSSLAPR